MKIKTLFTGRRRWGCIVMAAVMLLTGVVCVINAPAATFTKTVSGTCNYSYAQQITTSVNQLRSSRRVSTVVLDKELTDAAMQRAAEISVLFSHTRPDGSAWNTVNSRVCAENIASGYTTPQAAYQGWYGSAGHYANMVRDGYTAIGVGCFYNGNTWYWVQLFGYSIRVKDTRSSSTRKTFSVKVKGTDPSRASYPAPALKAVKKSGANEMKLTWTPVQGLTEYEIGCKMPGASDWVTIKLSNIGYSKKLDTVLMGLVYKGKYSIRIRGVFTVNGATRYTSWSSTKTIKMK